MSHLNEKRGELKEVMDKLQNLNDDYRSKVNKKRVRTILFKISIVTNMLLLFTMFIR